MQTLQGVKEGTARAETSLRLVSATKCGTATTIMKELQLEAQTSDKLELGQVDPKQGELRTKSHGELLACCKGFRENH